MRDDKKLKCISLHGAYPNQLLSISEVEYCVILLYYKL